MSAELLAKTLELKGILEEMQKNSATKAEVAEVQAKMAKDLDEIQRLAKESIRRVGTPGEYRPTAARKLADRGVTSVKGFESLGSIHKKTAIGQTSPDLAIDRDVMDVLELGETIALADAVLAGSADRGKDYEREKRTNGEKEAFCKRFPKIGKQWDAVVEDLRKTTGQLDSTTATLGDEWVPTQLFGVTLIDQIRLACPTVDLFPTIQMNGPTLTLPVKLNNGATYIKAEAGDAVITSLTTGQMSFTAKLQAYYTTWTDELVEDAVVAAVPMVRADAIRAFAEGKDQAMVSGDTTATHQDDDYESVTAHAAGLVDGMRRYCIKPATVKSIYTCAGTTALSSAEILGAAQTMGKYAANMMNDLVLLISTKDYLRLLTDTSLLTIDKLGSRATILNGQIASLAGIALMIDNEVTVRSDLSIITNAGAGATAGLTDAGVNSATDADNDYRTAVLVNRNAWIHAERRAFQLETDKDIRKGINQMVMTHRWDFQPKWWPASYPAHADTTGFKHTVTLVKILA